MSPAAGAAAAPAAAATDVLQEHEEEARSLVAALLENNVLELLVQRLTSFNEKVRPAFSAAVLLCCECNSSRP